MPSSGPIRNSGGVKSLIWTDTLKTFCLVGSLVLSIVFIMQALGMSFGEMTARSPASPYSRVFFFDDPPPTAISGRCSQRRC